MTNEKSTNVKTKQKRASRRSKKASSRPGIGATLYAGGVTFRVWAPHAQAVAVLGSFNDWSATTHPLGSEKNGYWSADVADVPVGAEYLYQLTTEQGELTRIDPYARAVTNSVGNGIVYDPTFDWGDDQFVMPPWNELVIYELHIGTFRDEPGGGPGSFASACERLPYLRELGINVVQVMPIAEFPGGFSWGYNPAHPFAVESDYGGPNAFKAFVKACHEQGIAVILDVVYNHFGPDDLACWRFDGWSENEGGGIYFYNDQRALTPWGATRPDYGRGEVRQYLRDNALMWLEEFRVDGLRWDATAYIRNIHGNENSPATDIPEGWTLLQWINQEIRERYPNVLSIAEDLRNNAFIVKPTEMGGAGFGAQWDPNFVHPLRAAIVTNDDAFRDLGAVRGALEFRYDEDAFRRVIYTESHDEVANGKARIPEEIWPGEVDSWFAKKRSSLGAALAFTAPGIPMLFQGQEFLTDRWFHDQDPLDWSNVERYSGILQLYRDLIHLRRNVAGQTRGLSGQQCTVYHVNDASKILAFHRWAEGGPGDSVVVIANFANQTLTDYSLGLPTAGEWQVRLNSDWEGYDAEFGSVLTATVSTEAVEQDGMAQRGKLNIAPYSVVILSQTQEA